jgi:mono/diheme cytochrome c family protein
MFVKQAAPIPALAVALAAAAGVAQAQGPTERPESPTPVVIAAEEREFLNSCASCHGDDGKGAGFLTRVFGGIDPGDLTLLAAQNGGTFPLERVFAVIDGREEVAAHGPRRMPVWGDRYMTRAMSEWGPDELNELRVENRIYALVHYLQSIQAATGAAD